MLSRAAGTVGGRSLGDGGGEAVVVEGLATSDFELRLRVLSRLRSGSQDDPGWFRKWRSKRELVDALCLVLGDRNWEVQHQCIKFLSEAAPNIGTQDIDWVSKRLIPQLVPKLASPKITVRRVTVSALHAVAVLHPPAFTALLHVLARDTLAPENGQATDALRELGGLITPELSDRDWAPLAAALVRLAVAPADPARQDLAIGSLEKMHGLVGRASFHSYIQRLPAEQRERYEHQIRQRGRGSLISLKDQPPRMERSETRASDIVDKQYRYGVIPINLYEVITSDADPKVKCASLEQLKAIIEGLGEAGVSRLKQHAFPYLNFLSNALDELNFKVVVCTLDVLRISVNRLGRSLESQLGQVMACLGKHLGNQKSVVKQLNMMSVTELAAALGPKPVLAALAPFLQHRNSRVREEVVNMMTALLLKYPSNAVNLSAVAHAIAPLLADPKRRSAGGLLSAVQARLARHQLPKIRYDGLVEYSIPMGGAESLRNHNGEEMADFHWILSAGVGPGSAIARSSLGGSSDMGAATQPSPLAPVRGTPSPPEWRSVSAHADTGEKPNILYSRKMQHGSQLARSQPNLAHPSRKAVRPQLHRSHSTNQLAKSHPKGAGFNPVNGANYNRNGPSYNRGGHNNRGYGASHNASRYHNGHGPINPVRSTQNPSKGPSYNSRSQNQSPRRQSNFNPNHSPRRQSHYQSNASHFTPVKGTRPTHNRTRGAHQNANSQATRAQGLPPVTLKKRQTGTNYPVSPAVSTTSVALSLRSQRSLGPNFGRAHRSAEADISRSLSAQVRG